MAISSAIVPFKGTTSSAIVKPQQSLSGIVPAKKEESSKKVQITTRDIRASVLRLLRKRQERDRLESKFYKLQDTLNEREKARKEEAKGEKNSFLGKVGSGFKSKAKKVGGDLFDSIGKLLGFLALDWISKPENQQLVAGIVEGIGHIFKFVDWFVTGSVDNLLSGFNSLIAGDTILERVLGFFQMAAGFMGIRYFLKPQLIVTDLMKLRKFIMDGGLRKLSIFNKKLQKFGLKKALKFAFPKLSKLLSKFTGIGGRVLNGIKNKLGLGKVGNLFGKITNGLLRKIPSLGVAKKAIFHILKPVTGFLKSIPFVGGLISFGVNMLLGDPPGKAGVKAIGSSLGSWLGAGLGTLLLPGVGTFIGGFLGGLVGDWLGSRFYDLLKGKDAKAPSTTERDRQEAAMAAAKMKQKNKDSGGDGELSDANLLEISGQLGNNPKTKKPYTIEEVKILLSDKPVETVTTTTTTTTTGDGGGGVDVGVYTPILDLIAKYESGSGGYESMYPGTTLPGATGMTIAEVARKATGAVGMYQNMPRFLNARAKAVGLDPNKALYDEENQRKIAVYLIEEGQAGVTPQMLKDNPDEAMIRLAKVWAAIPVPKAMRGHSKQLTKGESYYAGDGANKAHITPEMMYGAMKSSSNRGEGDGKPRRSPRKSPIPNRVHSIGSIPRQKPTKANLMSQISMNVVQSNRMKSRGMRKGSTIIIHKAGSTNISQESTSVSPGLNRNKPQLDRRGL